MNNDEELKKSLNDIIASKEFPFDEAAWASASAYIDNARKSKRRGLLFFILPAAILIIGGITFYVLQAQGKPNNTATLKVVESVNAPNPPSETAHNSPVTNSTIEQTAKANQPENTKFNNTPESIAPPLSANTKEQSPEGTNAVITKPADSVKPNSTTNQKNVTSTTKKQTSTKPKAEISVNNSITPVVMSPNNNPGNETNNSIIPLPNGQSATNSNDTTTNVPEPEQTNSGANEGVTTQTSAPLAPLPTESIAAVAAQPTNAVVNKPDTALNNSSPTPSVQPKWFVFAEGGLSYSFGYKNPGLRDGNGFNPVAGLFISNALTNKISVGLGAQYNQVSQMEYSTKVSKVTSYHYTEESDVTEITPQKLYYMVFPIKISYELNKNNCIGLGYNLGYLINASSKVETYHTGIKNTTDYKATRSLGYTQGLNTLDKQLTVFYCRRLAQKLWFNGELYYGLSDVKDNNFFKSDVKEKNSGIKLTLMYNFFSK